MQTYLSKTKESVPVQGLDFTDIAVPHLPSNKDAFLYKVAVTVQGNAAILHRFSRPLMRKWKRHGQARNRRTPDDKPYQRRTDNIKRAQRMSKLAIASILPTRKLPGQRSVFMTHTLAGTYEDRKQDFIWFKREHTKTMRRLLKLNPNICIITVFELQMGERKKDGTPPRMALHAHSVVVGLPYFQTNLDHNLRKLWPWGNTDIQEIGTSWDDRAKVIHYMTDYITKDAWTAGIKHARLYYTNDNLPARRRYQYAPYVRQQLVQMAHDKWLKLWVGDWIDMYKPTPEEIAAGRAPIQLQTEMWLAPP